DRRNSQAPFHVPFNMLGSQNDVSGTNFSKTVDDPIGIIDSVVVTRSTAITDVIGITDNRSIASGKTIIDPTGITDAQLLVQVKSIIDPVGITDTKPSLQRLMIGLAGQWLNSYSPWITRQGYQAGFNTPFQLQGSRIVTGPVDYVKTITDSVGITDVPITVATVSRVQSDSIGITDVAKLTHGLTQVDAVGVTDNKVSLITSLKTDLIGITDTRTITAGHTQTDSIGIT